MIDSDDYEDDDSDDWEDDDSDDYEDDDSDDWEDDDDSDDWEDDDSDDSDDDGMVVSGGLDLKDIDLTEFIKSADFTTSSGLNNPKILSKSIASSAMLGEAAGADNSSNDSNEDLEDSEDTNDSSSEEEIEDFNESAPLATSDLASGMDDGNVDDLASEEGSSTNKIDLTTNVTGHPVLMLILSLFGLFIVPFNKR